MYLVPNQMEVVLHWFRRDLRLEDNHALSLAGESGYPVLPVFIFDEDILSDLELDDARVSYIHQTLVKLNDSLRQKGSGIVIKYGKPAEVWANLIKEFKPVSVFANEDYEPYAVKRDSEVAEILRTTGSSLTLCKDQVIFHKDEVVKADGNPYTVFTPYSRKWKELFNPAIVEAFASDSIQFAPCEYAPVPSLEQLGFRKSSITLNDPDLSIQLLKNYKERRDIPSIDGTSRISAHLRFGTISIRHAVRIAIEYSETWLNELIWRSFFSQLLFHFPHAVHTEFKPAYSAIPWRTDQQEFEKWTLGMTGFPLVDAGMRELVQTGFMHNRVRMITASFLCKQLLMDWRLGEAFFAKHLLDYELSSNVGNWQWASGTGADAAPYFRVFNPVTQQLKFDPHYKYVRKWVPEFGTSAYPKPMLDLSAARERCLNVFKSNLNQR